MLRKTNTNIIFLLFVFFSHFFYVEAGTEVAILSWNIRDFGQSKNETELGFIASVIQDFDIVGIQEIVAGAAGPKAVAQLSDMLNRTGNKWGYVYSNPTQSPSGYEERYAFLWKTSKVKLLGKPWSEEEYQQEITREPFMARFRIGNQTILLVNFHALPSNKQPEREIKYFKFFPEKYKKEIIFFVGDFNLPETHTVFNPLKKMGYRPALINQSTTLKKVNPNKDGTFLFKAKDNIFYDSKRVRRVESGFIDFVEEFSNLEEANLISDHIPIWSNFLISVN